MAFTTDARVGCTAFFGFAAPATNLLLGDYEPVFRVLALLGQVSVAVVTVLYILAKIKALKKK